MGNNDEMEVICRACLNETNSFKCIYKVGVICGEITTLSAMLTECINLEFNEEEDLPRFICMRCVSQLSKAYAFRQTVLKSNETLRDQQLGVKTEDEIIDTLFYYDQQSENQSEIAEDDDGEGEEDEEEGEDEEQVQEQEQDEIIQIRDEGDDVGVHTDDIKIELTTTENDDTQYEVTEIKDGDEMVIERNEEVVDESSQASSCKDADILQTVEKMLTQKRLKRRRKPIPGPPFKCETCGKILSNHSSYKYHMQLHSDSTPFLCSHCGEKFKTRNAYDGHMTTHDSLKPNSCNICGKNYRQPSSLRIHILTHTGEKPYLCGICGKGLTQKSGFKKHMLVHTGEKPFKCDVCNKEFRYSSNLITHKRGHTGEKPFSCKDCDKKFTSGEQLKRHHLIHSGEKPFSCETCGKSFNRRSTLMVHRQTHNGKTTAASKNKQQ